MKIGKELTISIPQDVIVDAAFIKKVINRDINYNKPFFNLIDDDECRKLIKYMDDNKLIIEPGKYIIAQTWTSEKIIENLKFKE